MPAYIEDTTGLSPANAVLNELHPVGNVQNVSHRTIVPSFAPFFKNDYEIEHVSAANVITPMVLDTDYKFSMDWISASESLVNDLCGGCTIYTTFSDGHYRIKKYQTIGGAWLADPAIVLQTVLTLAYNPRLVYWEQVTNVPTVFPPDRHPQPADDLTRLNNLIDVITTLTGAVLNNVPLGSHTTSATPHQLAMLTTVEKNVVLTAIGSGNTAGLSTTIKNRQVTVNDLLELANALITYRS